MYIFFLHSISIGPLIESVLAVSAARVHPDRIVSRRWSRGGIRQQWQSTSEQRGSQRNRSKQGPKRSHSRGTKGNGHPEIQVRFLHFHQPFSSFPSDELFTSFFMDFRQWKVALFTAYLASGLQNQRTALFLSPLRTYILDLII